MDNKRYCKLVEYYNEDGELRHVHIPTRNGTDGAARKKFSQYFPLSEIIDVMEGPILTNDARSDKDVIESSLKLLND